MFSYSLFRKPVLQCKQQHREKLVDKKFKDFLVLFQLNGTFFVCCVCVMCVCVHTNRGISAYVGSFLKKLQGLNKVNDKNNFSFITTTTKTSQLLLLLCRLHENFIRSSSCSAKKKERLRKENLCERNCVEWEKFIIFQQHQQLDYEHYETWWWLVVVVFFVKLTNPQAVAVAAALHDKLLMSIACKTFR